MARLGLAAPLASQLLARAGLAQAPVQGEYKPTKAGGGGALGMDAVAKVKPDGYTLAATVRSFKISSTAKIPRSSSSSVL